jgi:hypothetical protein
VRERVNNGSKVERKYGLTFSNADLLLSNTSVVLGGDPAGGSLGGHFLEAAGRCLGSARDASGLADGATATTAGLPTEERGWESRNVIERNQGWEILP